jgi:alpha-tubulin suppressor-like RCC1 family protein
VAISGTVTKVSASATAACAVVGDVSASTIYCWGQNTTGGLSCSPGGCADGGSPQPYNISPAAPYHIGSTSSFTLIGNGLYALCAGSVNGAIQCFGTDAWGNLGDGMTNPGCCAQSAKPFTLSSGNLRSIEGSDFYTVASDDNNNWYGWGGNYGEGCAIYNGKSCQDQSSPVLYNIGATILDLSPGWRHACASVTGGGVMCWGNDQHGQLGDGSMVAANLAPATTSLPPSAIPVKDLAAHRHWTCALGADSQVYCWGQNGDQNDATPWLLGVGSPMGDVPKPQPVRWE